MQVLNGITIVICGVAAYFVLLWGGEAAVILTSPLHGLGSEDFSRSVAAASQLFGRGAIGTLVLAMLFGGAKLATAVCFAIYLARRLAFSPVEGIDRGVLETGFALVVITIACLALPLVLAGQSAVLDPFRVPLWLVGLAATLTLIERMTGAEADRSAKTLERLRKEAVIPASLMRGRLGVPALRWNLLRREAGLDR